MIVDFHTHIFPDKIANSTISALSQKGGTPAYSDGTMNGLINALDRAGAQIAVNLPALTKPSQFDGILRFAKVVNEGQSRVISFAGAHPDMDDKKAKMRLIKESGIKGIKIHPDYQGTFFDDDKYYELLKCAKDEDLIVVTHSGVDIGFIGEPVKCTPDRVLKMLSRLGGYDKLVLAHLGGDEFFGEVLEKLAGKDIYFDTAYVLKKFTEENFKKIVYKHGEDKILFATDSPWSDVYGDVRIIKNFGLNKRTEDKIFYKNALDLLGVKE